MTPERAAQVNTLMLSVYKPYRSHWCESNACACVGCVNGSGSVLSSDIDITKAEWEAWCVSDTKRNLQVHRSHCCDIHGCKYGDNDCPVKNNEVIQDHLCESCNDCVTQFKSIFKEYRSVRTLSDKISSGRLVA